MIGMDEKPPGVRDPRGREAAVHLMIDYWRAERSKRNLEHYGWINETGYFSAEE